MKDAKPQRKARLTTKDTKYTKKRFNTEAQSSRGKTKSLTQSGNERCKAAKKSKVNHKGHKVHRAKIQGRGAKRRFNRSEAEKRLTRKRLTQRRKEAKKSKINHREHSAHREKIQGSPPCDRASGAKSSKILPLRVAVLFRRRSWSDFRGRP
jgi:hypothetical protein